MYASRSPDSRVQRQVRRPRLPGPPASPSTISGRPRQAQPHHLLRARTRLPPGSRASRFGPRVQLRVAQHAVPAHHRHRIRASGAACAANSSGTVPRRHRPPPCRSTRCSSCARSASSRIELRAAGRPGRRRPPPAPGQPAAQSPRRSPRRTGRWRPSTAAQPGQAVPATGLGQVDRQVELGRPGPRSALGRTRSPGRSSAGGGVVLQDEHDLEQRVRGQATASGPAPPPAARTARPGARTPPGRPPAPAPAARERRVAATVGAQHQGVDEEPDQVVERGVGPARHRRADRDVVARAQPRSSTASAACTTMNSVTPCSRASPASRACSSAGTLERHRGRRGSRAPPGAAGRPAAPAPPARRPARPASRRPAGTAAARVVLVAEQLPLPQRVVGVLHRQRRPARRAARPAGPRRRPPGRGPATPSDQPSVAMWCTTSTSTCSAGASREQPRPDGSSAARSNGVAGDPRQRAAPVRPRRGAPAARQPSSRRRPATCWYGSPVRRPEHGAQHLVPRDHVGQRRAPARGSPARPSAAAPAARCRSADGPSSWCRNHSRCCANDSGTPRPAGDRGDQRRPAPRPARPAGAASPPGVGASNSARTAAPRPAPPASG